MMVKVISQCKLHHTITHVFFISSCEEYTCSQYVCLSSAQQTLYDLFTSNTQERTHLIVDYETINIRTFQYPIDL